MAEIAEQPATDPKRARGGRAQGRRDHGERSAAPDRAALRTDWEAVFGAGPHPHLSERFMAKALAWHRQCAAASGFPRRLGKRLDLIGIAAGAGAAPAATLDAGTLLAREWNGRLYHVEVVADGFRFDGRSWRSLSAIARRITGTPWSGPRFFGLRSRQARG